jgi:hypothetical protein
VGDVQLHRSGVVLYGHLLSDARVFKSLPVSAG